jgi:hypothetical protein
VPELLAGARDSLDMRARLLARRDGGDGVDYERDAQPLRTRPLDEASGRQLARGAGFDRGDETRSIADASREHTSLTMPIGIVRVTSPATKRPRVSLRPIRPQLAAGTRIDPPPSLPCAKGTTPAATSAAEPPEEPPLECASFHGLRVGAPTSGSVVQLKPNSGIRVLPRTVQPKLASTVVIRLA